MAKQCVYCGQPLMEDDARFCHECGRLQIPPTDVAAAPSAIKVRLPPKEFSRADPLPPYSEKSLPGLPPGVTRPAQREQPAQQPSRMPKRPSRLTSQVPPLADEKGGSGERSMPEKPSSAWLEQSQPKPLEELSTMVMPGWREELALLRKEQEQARANSAPPAPAEKPAENTVQEPPALPRRIPGTPLAPRETTASEARTPSPQRDALPEPAQRTPAPPTNTRSMGLPRRPQDTPLPVQKERPRRPPNALTPLPPQEKIPSAESSRPELHAKSWEQEPTLHYPQARLEEQEAGPAPAIEQNPLASVSLGQDDLIENVSEVATVHWQTPISPLPSPPAEEEKRPAVKEERSPLPEVADGQPLSAESGQQTRKESQQPDSQQTGKNEIEVEDLPTVPLAVPEAMKPEPPIKIERTSTPAPKNWGNAQVNEVEDQPTRPMPTAASPASAAPRSPVPPAAPGVPNPFSGPGAGVPPLNAIQASGAVVDPQAARGRPMNPPSQPGQRFDPVSLPPLPQNPPSMPGNTQLGPGTQRAQQRPLSPFPDAPAQRPPALTPWPEAAAAAPEKPRKNRHVGRVLAIVLIVLVVLGAGGFFYVYQTTAAPSIIQPYQAFQNSAFGVSLSYPQGWKANINQAHSVVLFTDSSHTNQVNLSLAPASGQLSDYLNQQNKQWGIISPKTAPAATFAGSSWQQEQGSVTQQGATYTIELYVTQHNTHFYSLAFLAPAKSFAQEQNDFAHVRSTFSFI